MAKKRATYLSTYTLGPAGWIKGILTLTGIGTMVVLALVLVRQEAEETAPGQIAAVHSLYANDCQQCHTGKLQLVKKFTDPTGWDTTWRKTCRTCHPQVDHSPHENATSRPACVMCHLEHQGRSAQLTQVADQMCTQCHANLSAHVQTPPGLKIVRHDSQGQGATIESFNHPQHPEFSVSFYRPADAPSRAASQPPAPLQLVRLRLNDPRLRDGAQINFNHYEHLEGKVKQLIEEQHLKRTAFLTCESCHTLDAAGAYMEPISFDKHCKTCHEKELIFDEDELTPPAPHDNPLVVERFLCGLYARRYLDQKLKDINTAADDKGVYAGRPGQRTLSAQEVEMLQQNIPQRVRDAEAILFDVGCENNTCQGCRTCHHSLQTDKQWHPCPMPAFGDAGRPARVMPPAIPSRWFAFARFKHIPHKRAYKAEELQSSWCEGCHMDARFGQPISVRQSTETEHILIPGIAKCQECHGSNRNVSPLHSADHRVSKRKASTGGIRGTCITCHTYHPRAEGPVTAPIWGSVN